MKSVREILPPFYRNGVHSGPVDEELVLSYWATTVGPGIARRTRPLRLFGAKLVVEVDGREWQRQLTTLRKQIALRLNAAVGAKVVGEIRFLLPSPAKIPPRRAATAAGSALDRTDEASGIEDPNLRRLYRISAKQEKKQAN